MMQCNAIFLLSYLGLLSRCDALPIERMTPLLAVVQAIFGRADVNGDGMMDLAEYWTTFQSFDTDANGEIEEIEYMSAILRMPGLDAIGGMADRGRLANLMFGMGDLNNNGKLDLDDATTIKTNMDVDGDGKISLDEYTARWIEVIKRCLQISP